MERVLEDDTNIRVNAIDNNINKGDETVKVFEMVDSFIQYINYTIYKL